MVWLKMPERRHDALASLSQASVRCDTPLRLQRWTFTSSSYLRVCSMWWKRYCAIGQIDAMSEKG
jgi:hypothetical protein